ncbi:MAG: response regulator transcription factor [Eubacteriales bacterium]|nr:response regulator transcription factor [Eubacteriales bacterium]
MKKILVIDDNEEILQLIKRILIKNDYIIDCKTSLNPNNLDILKGYSLILLDVMLGTNYDGFDICRKIRDEILTPIVFITAKTTEEDLLEGFSAGGDDYIKKPFTPNELLARVNAHIRREDRKDEQRDLIVYGDINIYKDEKVVYVREEKIELTNKEFAIIELLATNPSRVFTQEQIYDRIYDYDSDSLYRGISEFVYQIRNKFKKLDINPITTVRGIGYKWKIEA